MIKKVFAMGKRSIDSKINSPIVKMESMYALDLMISVLDQIDEKVLIIKKNGDFFYGNQKYVDYYRLIWEKSGFSIEDLYKQNVFRMDDPDSNTLRKYLENPTVVDKYFNSPGGEKFKHDVFTDIYPLQLKEEYFGLVVIEHDTKLVESLNQQLNYYKSLSMNLKHQLYDKNELPESFKQVVGDSVQMLRVLSLCAHIAPTQSSVCLLGESGTGKEVLAEAIHHSSNHVTGPLIKVNCAAIPDTLIESELFGYEKGAFTGANPQGSAGKFELANGGTLFLDEIGEMSLPMQAKLLRVIQEREISRLGSSKTIKLNFRLITATNKDLEKMIEEGTFREDLYYRICVIPIYIPPLRDRRGDIVLLANRFLEEFNTDPKMLRTFSESVLEEFTQYNWPGNIRELKNCVERMSILCPDACIGSEFLPVQITKKVKNGTKEVERGKYNLHEIIDKVEYDTIKAVLEITKGNKTNAIEMLGISKRNFYLKLEKFGLK